MFVVNKHTHLSQLTNKFNAPFFSVTIENCFQMSDLPCFAFVK